MGGSKRFGEAIESLYRAYYAAIILQEMVGLGLTL